MEELLTLVQHAPRRSLEAGEVLITDGQGAHPLYVLLSGALRVEKAGAAIALVTERGACVGEMSLLLGVPATADVLASERSEVAVIDDAPANLDEEGSLTLTLARLLAGRLQVMTTYLADLKRQYADHEGGLGMVDVVLGSLMRSPGPRTQLGSDRDPEPEY
ncbi:MAG: cyclic nucleotide-binding domain-containing protein [Acidimicrobiia bacterium]